MEFITFSVNYEKRAKRRELLNNKPELRTRINTSKLKQIISYRAFRCFNDCSIARDEAIKGSDIDGGLVITASPCNIKSQLAFVHELRNQGFTAYHELEYRKLVEFKRKNPPTIDELMRFDGEISEIVVASLSRILFHTVEEIENIIRTPYGDEYPYYPPIDYDYNPPIDEIKISYTDGFDIDTKEINNLYLGRTKGTARSFQKNSEKVIID